MAFLVQILAAELPIKLPANMPAKAVGDGPSIWAPVCT